MPRLPAVTFTFATLLATCAAVGTTRSSHAQQSTTMEDCIAKTNQMVIGRQGYVDQELYDRYWGCLGLEGSNVDLIEQRRVAAKELGLGVAPELDFQRVLWDLTVRSIRAKKPVGLAELDEAFAPVKKRGAAPTNLDRAKQMVRAAAAGKPVDQPRGKAVITREKAEAVSLGLSGALERLERLTAPEYREKPEKRTYSWCKVELASPDSFSPVDETLDSSRCRLTRRTNETDSQFVFTKDLDTKLSDDKTLKAELTVLGNEHAKEVFGISQIPRTEFELWKGLASMGGTFVVQAENGMELFGSMRLVYDRHNNRIVSMIAAADESLDAARALRLQLESAATLIKGKRGK